MAQGASGTLAAGLTAGGRLRSARRHGKWTGGTTPFGYQLHDGKLIADPATAGCVRHLVDLYLTTFSATKVASMLNGDGSPRPSRSRQGWTKPAVLRVLTSPTYAGLLRVGDGELVAGEHAALVERGTWQAVQDHLSGRRAGTPARGAVGYLLRGLLRCACCGERMTGATTHNGARRYRYYRCLTRDKRGAGACPEGQVAADPVEARVVAVVHERIQVLRGDRDLVEAVNAAHDATREALRGEQMAIARRVAQLAAVRHEIAQRAAGAISPQVQQALDDNDAAAALAATERQAIEAKLEQLRELLDTRAQVATALSQLDQVWAVLTNENRWRLLHAALEQVSIRGGDGAVDVVFADALTLAPEAARAVG